MNIILLFLSILLLAILAGVPLFGLPATLSLRMGIRQGLKPLTISQAAEELRASDKTGLDLAEAARALVAERMAYSRRNSFDTHARAFKRGYGYCQQMSYALVDLLNRLGFEAKVVHAFRNRLADGREVSHAWVQVTVGGQDQYVDSLFYDSQARTLGFTPLSEVLDYSPAFRILAGWGSIAVNAHRYYRTGKDF